MGKLFKTIITVASIATIASVAYMLTQKNDDSEDAEVTNSCSKTQRISFDSLIKSQYVCDELDGAKLTEWFRKQSENSSSEVLFIIAKLTDKNAAMLGLQAIPDNLDREHSMLQAVVIKSTYDTQAIRLVSFEKIVTELNELFENQDFVVLEDK